MKTEAIQEVFDAFLVGCFEGDTEMLAKARGELKALEEAHTEVVAGLRWCRGYFQRIGDAAALATLNNLVGSDQ